MQVINILILSAGRRIELIQCFKKASQNLKIKSEIVVADISNLAPAMYFADKAYIIPKIGEKGYIEEIEKICQIENIKLIIPTIDTELLLLSENRDRIETETGAKVLVSSYDVISTCRDKEKHKNFLKKINLECQN